MLIYRPGSLGDTVVALPCLKLIRKTFPDAELKVLTNAPVANSAPPVAAVLEGMGLADSYLEYPVPLDRLSTAWRVARAIRRWRPDRMIYLARRERPGQVRRDVAFFRACGIRNITGLPLTRDLLKNRQRADGMFEREAERLARTMAPLGAIDLSDSAVWDLGLTDAERTLPRRLIAERVGALPFIAVSIGTKQAPNDWGIDNWRAVVGHLSRTYPHEIVFIGAEGDRVPSDAVTQGLGDRAVNLCGRLTVRESAALIAAASLFVGHDSGPMHLAAAVGTPSVAVFSSLWVPGIWFPMGSRAAVLYPSKGTQSITSASVLDAVQALLPAGATRKLAGEP